MAPLYLGIEIGGTKLQLGLGEGDGQILALERRKVDPSLGALGILGQIKSAFEALLQFQSLPASAIAGVGIGFGGPVDPGRGITTKSHQIEGWDQFPLADWIRENLKVERVAIQNDADAAGLAEALYGAGKGYSPLLYVTIGSGIGGGLICDGTIYRGAGAGAVEVGHVWVRNPYAAGRPLIELEKVSSGWGISNRGREIARSILETSGASWVVLERAGNDPDLITTQLIADAAREGDPRSLEILTMAREAFAEGLRQAVTLLAPRRIVLGGGVSLIGVELWVGPVREQLNRDVFVPFRGTFDLVVATLGEDVVVQGALAIAHS